MTRDQRPTVSVLVLNLNGRAYLKDCFDSLHAQTYPADRFEVVLIDNGSTDDSLVYVRSQYPRVRILALDSNRGFCAPYNTAVRSCASEFVALLNNDTRVDPEWLTELISAAERHDVVAVGSKILSWDGTTIDFVGGAVSFAGHSWQLDFGEPAAGHDEEKPLLFPCAGSALYLRAAFLDAGGFDEEFFAYFEDVDLGWRMNLLGGRVVLAPRAVTYHRMHGTASRWAFAQRLRLLERNALAMIYKNYEAATLEQVLPAAVALLLLRATQRSGIDTLSLTWSALSPDVVDTHPYLTAHLIALEDFCLMLPELKRKREQIQSRRRRPDAELSRLFVEPLRVHETGGLYEEVARTLIREFGIDKALEPIEAASSSVRCTVADTAPVNPAGSSGQQPPRISIVILTALGATHLTDCLTSIRQQNYPPDRIEVIVVDNASKEDPTSRAQALFPGACVIRNGSNIGFAAGNNRGAAAASGDYVVFLNDDTRVHPDWLKELVATARRRNATAVACYILDWGGTSVDFVDGAVNFEGKGFQLHYGASSAELVPEEKPLLFACGCAMLIDRAVFADAGGWDEGTFAYYEDVELGWRLQVLGHQVWLSPRAIVYHKHHGTSGTWPTPPRLRLLERNALRSLYGLLETRSLQRALPAALVLAADRALLESGLSRAADEAAESELVRLKRAGKAALIARGINRSTSIAGALSRIWHGGLLKLPRDIWRSSRGGRTGQRRESYLIERGGVPAAFDAQPQPMPIAAAALLSGIYGFLADIPQLASRRAEIQRRRLVDDRAVLQRFGTHWLSPSGANLQAEHHAMHSLIVEAFDLAEINGPPAGD